MPTYDYRCPNGHAFEVFQKMSDDPVATCPECGAAAERQLSGGAGFLFRGDGFYITDYRSESYRKAAEKEKKAAGGGAGSGGADGGSSGDAASSGGGASDAAPKGGSGSAGSTGTDA